MNLRQMEVFRSFMLTGTISEAAKLLGVSQPAVSSMLHHVQDRSGLRLFEQVKGRLLPTQEAKLLFEEIGVAWKSVERVQRLCLELANSRVGLLRVAATTSLGVHVIPSAIKDLGRSFPGLTVSLELFTPALLIECLAAEEADIGIATGQVEHPGLLASQPGSAPLLCVMPPDHRLVRQSCVQIRDLADEPLVMHSFELPEGLLIADAFRQAGLVPKTKLQVRSGQSACWFVRSGAGVALLDATTVAGSAFPDLVVRPLEPSLALPITILRNPLKPLSKAAAAFRDRIECHCRREFPLIPPKSLERDPA